MQISGQGVLLFNTLLLSVFFLEVIHAATGASIGGNVVLSGKDDDYVHFIYFSLASLTTAGFGDIYAVGVTRPRNLARARMSEDVPGKHDAEQRRAASTGARGDHIASSPVGDCAALSPECAWPARCWPIEGPFRGSEGGRMSRSDAVFAGSIPKLYDTLMVPLIFEDYAANVAALVAESSPVSVLETAAGSGVVTRALAPRLGAGARYVVTDLNQPMLDYAASRQSADARIEWRQADALDLPFEDAAFDVVCCQFGVMFFGDRIAGYAEARRVLRTGGRFVFSVWDRIEENIFADDVTNGVATVFPHDPPRFLARTPHGYHDIALIRRELSRAGFADIAIVTREEVSRAPSASHAAVAYCHGTPLRNEIEARDAGLLQLATERATAAIASRHGAGPVAGKIQAHVIVAAR